MELDEKDLENVVFGIEEEAVQNKALEHEELYREDVIERLKKLRANVEKLKEKELSLEELEEVKVGPSINSR